MAELTPTDFMLLADFAYLDIPSAQREALDKGQLTVGEVVDTALANGRIPVGRAGMDEGEWREILRRISGDPDLRDMVLWGEMNENPGAEGLGLDGSPGNGLRGYCLVEPPASRSSQPAHAVVAFRGSEADDWDDNFAAIGGETAQQSAAADALDRFGFASYSVTGHSKGGNDAQHTAIVDSRVTECFSFDGQGFSLAYLEAHAGEIAANAEKITSISSANEIVNALLFPVAGTTVYLPGGGNPINVERAHSVWYLYDPTTGELRGHDPVTGQIDGTDRNPWITAGHLWLTALSVFMPPSVGSDIVDDVFDILGGRISLDSITTIGLAVVALVTLPLWLPALAAAAKAYLVTVAIVALYEYLRDQIPVWVERIRVGLGKIAGAARDFFDAVGQEVVAFNNRMKSGWDDLVAATQRTADAIVASASQLEEAMRLLQSAQRDLKSADDALNELLVLVPLDQLAHVIWADWRTGRSLNVGACAAYVQQVVISIRNTERSIMTMVTAVSG